MPSFMTLRLQTKKISDLGQTDKQTNKPTMRFIYIDILMMHTVSLLRASYTRFYIYNSNICNVVFVSDMPLMTLHILPYSWKREFKFEHHLMLMYSPNTCDILF